MSCIVLGQTSMRALHDIARHVLHSDLSWLIVMFLETTVYACQTNRRAMVQLLYSCIQVVACWMA
jgi:hypothetical protein